jgi:iron complex transport system substrate-binding protein
MRARRYLAVLAVLGVLLAGAALATPYEVIDDRGQRVGLSVPAQRIVSLSPAITEMLFAAGAGDRIVAASEFSDYPAEARLLPRVARAQSIDLERIAALHPDLIVVWASGYPPAMEEALQRLGIPVYVQEARTLDAIASNIERLGKLTDSPVSAGIAGNLRERVRTLRQRYQQRTPVLVFYQTWPSPVMTLGGRHVISEALKVCGATNVFADLRQLSATVAEEAVLARDPQLLLASEPGGHDRGALARWKKFPHLHAIADGHLVTLDSDHFDRPTPRMIEAVGHLCEVIDHVREDDRIRGHAPH